MKKKSLFAAAALSAVLLAGCGDKAITSEQVKESALADFATEYLQDAKKADETGLIVIESATKQYLYFKNADGEAVKIKDMKFTKKNDTRNSNYRVDITTEAATDAADGDAVYEFQNAKNLETLDIYVDGKETPVSKVYANH